MEGHNYRAAISNTDSPSPSFHTFHRPNPRTCMNNSNPCIEGGICCHKPTCPQISCSLRLSSHVYVVLQKKKSHVPYGVVCLLYYNKKQSQAKSTGRRWQDNANCIPQSTMIQQEVVVSLPSPTLVISRKQKKILEYLINTGTSCIIYGVIVVSGKLSEKEHSL